jgi:hypothetical protein
MKSVYPFHELSPHLNAIQDSRRLLLTSESLCAILQHSQKATEGPLAALRSHVADGLAHCNTTETTVCTDEPVTGVSCLPATPSIPIEALSSFQTTDFWILLLQPLDEGNLPNWRQTSLWQKAGLIFAAVARALFTWPLIRLHWRQAYYWISLAELHNRYMDEVIVPWVEEIACAVTEETGTRRIATTSVEGVDMGSHREQVKCLLALRCNVSAVVAVLL